MARKKGGGERREKNRKNTKTELNTVLKKESKKVW